MIQKQITINQYEVGDLIDVSEVHPKFHSKKCLNQAERAIVVNVNILIDGRVTYKVITNNGYMCSFTHDEQGTEKFIGHIDLKPLFGDEKASR